MNPGKYWLPLLALLLAALACGSPAALPEAPTAAGVAFGPAAHTAEPIKAPSPVPSLLSSFPSSPSPSPIVLGPLRPSPTPKTVLPSPSPVLSTAFTLQQELYFWWGGGGVPGSQGDCLELAPGDLPAIRDSGRNTRSGSLFKNNGSVCLYGFPTGQPIQVSVFRPDGSAAGEASLVFHPWNPGDKEGYLMRVGDDDHRTAGVVYLGDPDPVIELLLWLPLGTPEGKWRIEAKAGVVAAGGAFTVGPKGDDPSLDLVYDFGASPLVRQGFYDSFSGIDCPVYTAGEQARLSLTHLPPNQAIPIGLYRDNQLVRQVVASAGSQGEASGALQILPDDPMGEYWVVAVLDLQAESPDSAGPFACLYVPSWQPCPDAPPSRLSAGMDAQVNPDVPGSNRVRSQPGLSGGLTGKLDPGQSVSIVDGPACADGMVWWQVEYSAASSDLRTGWTSEGDGKESWLVPGE